MLSLYFEPIVLQRASCAAGVLQLREQCREVIPSWRQTAYHRDNLTFLAFLDRQSGRLLVRRDSLGWWRGAMTLRFQFSATVATRWLKERSAGK